MNPACRLRASVLLLLVATIGCAGPSATPEPPTAAPTPILRDAPPGGPAAPAAPSPPPTLARVAPAASAVLTYSLSTVDLPAPLDGRPGPWSPDGRSLVAYAGGPRQPEGWSGTLWVVDAETGRPRWPAEDLRADPAREQAAAWLSDGSLALARSDGPFVDAEGRPVAGAAGLDGQPRQVHADPTGQIVLFTGPDGAWLARPGAPARFLSGWPPLGEAAWSWSPDGLRLALGRSDGRYSVIDVASGESIRVAEAIERPEADGMPAPRWLADGRLLLTAARELRYQDGSEYDHRLIEVDSTRASSLVEMLGIPRNPVRPGDLARAVSPDGRYLLYPEHGSEEGPARATWLLDLVAGRLRAMAPIEGRVHWSPASDRFAVLRADGIDLHDPEFGPVLGLSLPDEPLAFPSWSPDGRWLLLADRAARLWLIAVDGSAAPLQLADDVVWPPLPSWSPAGDRFAFTVDPMRGITETELPAPQRLLLATIAEASRP